MSYFVDVYLKNKKINSQNETAYENNLSFSIILASIKYNFFNKLLSYRARRFEKYSFEKNAVKVWFV